MEPLSVCVAMQPLSEVAPHAHHLLTLHEVYKERGEYNLNVWRMDTREFGRSSWNLSRSPNLLLSSYWR